MLHKRPARCRTGGHKDLSTASDAVFVYMAQWPFDVEIGDQVSVSATVSEFGGLTELTEPTVTPVAGSYRPVRPVSGISWAATAAHRENLESMLFATLYRCRSRGLLREEQEHLVVSVLRSCSVYSRVARASPST